MSLLDKLKSAIPKRQPAPPNNTTGNADADAEGALVPNKKRDPMDPDLYPDREPDPDIDMDQAEGWITGIFPKLKSAFLVYHQNVWQCILFYVGQTWLTWDKQRSYYDIAEPEDEYTPMPRINYFAPAIDAVASNFNSIPPIECSARDAEGDEQYRRHGIAEIANRLGKDFILRTGLKSDFQSKGDKPSEAAQMFVLSGTVLTYVQARDMGTVDSSIGPIAQKSVECDLVNAITAIPRPGSCDIGGLGGSPYMLLSRRMTLQECYNRFGVNVSADKEYLDGYNALYQSALNYYYTGFNASDVAAEDSALVTEIFVPPTSPTNSGLREFAEEGLYGVYANNELKYAEKWQFPDHPLTKIDYIRVPTLFFGRTPAFDLLPIQQEIQQYWSIIKLHAMTNATTPWVVDANTLVGEITGRGDKVIKYRSLGPNSPAPKREQAGVMDNGVYQQIAKLEAQFESISGAASVFRGRQEGSVVAASAISQLRGQAEQMFSRPVQNWNNGWKETVRKAVLYMQKCYTLTQIMAIVGEGMTDAISDFMSCDLDTCVEWMAADHGLPRTQDELRQEMLTLFDKKALDPNDPNVKERLFRLFGETGMLTQFNLDATRARMENKMMKKGVHPVFRPAIEDLQTHYTLHVEAVKSMDFDRYTPQVQEIFLAHVMETKAALAPPAPPAPPASLAFTAKLEDLPPQLTDAVLESHGLHPASEVPPPPPHALGKPQDPNAPPINMPHPGTVTRGGEHPRNAHDKPHMASNGVPTGSPLMPQGQGIHPVGTSQGAPPAPATPLAPKA